MQNSWTVSKIFQIYLRFKAGHKIQNLSKKLRGKSFRSFAWGNEQSGDGDAERGPGSGHSSWVRRRDTHQSRTGRRFRYGIPGNALVRNNRSLSGIYEMFFYPDK